MYSEKEEHIILINWNFWWSEEEILEPLLLKNYL